MSTTTIKYTINKILPNETDSPKSSELTIFTTQDVNKLFKIIKIANNSINKPDRVTIKRIIKNESGVKEDILMFTYVNKNELVDYLNSSFIFQSKPYDKTLRYENVYKVL